MRKLTFILTILTLTFPARAADLLKKSTAVTITLKPLIVFATGARKTSGVTLHAAHVLLSKNGGAVAAKNSATASTIDATTGCRQVTLDATDTGTVGRLIVDWPDDANGVSTPESFQVVDANTYNGFFNGEIDLYSYRGNPIMTADGEYDFATAIAASLATLFGAPVGATFTVDFAAIKAAIGTPASDLATELAEINADIGEPTGASIAADIAAGASDSAAAVWQYNVDADPNALLQGRAGQKISKRGR